MVGIFGGGSVHPENIDSLSTGHRFDGGETVCQIGGQDVTLAAAGHSDTGVSSASLDDGRKVIIWGNIYGHGSADGYTQRDTSAARFVADMLDTHGIDGLRGLNGDFSGGVFDSAAGELRLFVDRLGTRPLYYSSVSGGGFIIASLLQALADVPCFTSDIDEELLIEYITFNRTFGVETPLHGVEQVAPGSVLTIDLADDSATTKRYWYPQYRPNSKPYTDHLAEFVELIRTVVAEQMVGGGNAGLMLSGGSDSRLLTTLLSDTPAYHISGWESPETQTARKVAAVEGLSFELLQRDKSYIPGLVADSSQLNNFTGYFQEAHALGFRERLRKEVDTLVHGLFSDALFKGHLYPTRSVSLGFEDVPLPIKREVESPEGLIDIIAARGRTPAFIPEDAVRDALETHIYTDKDAIIHHGVRYRTLADAASVSWYYPLTNDGDYNHYSTAIQTLPHRTPMLDYRLIDFHLQYPRAYQLRRDIINDAIAEISPAAAAIPHGSSFIPLHYPHAVRLPAKYATLFYHKYIAGTPEPHHSAGAWVDHDGLLRNHPFAKETLEAHSDDLAAIDSIDGGAVTTAVDEHGNGTGRWEDFYALVTLLNMPVVQEYCRNRQSEG